MAFFLPKAMTIHYALLFQRVQTIAGEKPLLVVGDFNITPDSDQCKMIKNGYLNLDSSSYPKNLIKNWIPKLNYPMKSAYETKMGIEPNFTNYGQNGEKPPFVFTLDYIWLSHHWKVISVVPLPNRDSIKNPLPNEDEPSDHLLLGAELGF